MTQQISTEVASEMLAVLKADVVNRSRKLSVKRRG
jgi:hypothetical protein